MTIHQQQNLLYNAYLVESLLVVALDRADLLAKMVPESERTAYTQIKAGIRSLHTAVESMRSAQKWVQGAEPEPEP